MCTLEMLVGDFVCQLCGSQPDRNQEEMGAMLMVYAAPG